MLTSSFCTAFCLSVAPHLSELVQNKVLRIPKYIMQGCERLGKALDYNMQNAGQGILEALASQVRCCLVLLLKCMVVTCSVSAEIWSRMLP